MSGKPIVYIDRLTEVVKRDLYSVIESVFGTSKPGVSKITQLWSADDATLISKYYKTYLIFYQSLSNKQVKHIYIAS